MSRLFFWIKMHKLSTLLILILLIVIFNNYLKGSARQRYDVYESPSSGAVGIQPFGAVGMAAPDFAPSSEVFVNKTTTQESSSRTSDRMVIQNSTISLLVNNVEQVKDMILAKTRELGGFMVSTNVNNPHDAATATITVRVPSTKLESAVKEFRGLAIRVTSEYLSGEDVTDEYTDIQAQMATLLTTKEKFEEILDRATAIQDILNVQRELINLQSQIDSLKGQQLYIERNAEMARITIYLSTDELALPYAPDEMWRPQLIFKQAVRSMIGTVRQVGTLVIWLGVYSVIWIPLLLIIYFVRRRMRKTTTVSQ